MRTGDRIRLARDRLRMTQKDLAGPDFHRSLISQIETGLIEPSLHTLTVLADRVGLPASYFIESDGEKERTGRAIEQSAHLVAGEEYDKAYQTLLDALTSVSSFPLRGSLLVQAGDMLLRARRPVEALTHLRVAERYLRLGDDINTLIDALARLGRALKQLGHLQAATDTFEEALWLLDHAAVADDREVRRSMRRLKIELTLSIGRTWAHRKDGTKALEWLHKAVDLASDAGLYFEVGLAHQSIAVAHHLTGDKEAAIYHNRIALGLFEGAEHPGERAISLGYNGYMAYKDHDWGAASSFYREALQGTENVPEYQLMPMQGLAITSLGLQEYDHAAEWSDKVLAALAAWSYTGPFARRQIQFASAIALVARMMDASENVCIEHILQPELSWYQSDGFVEATWQAMERSVTDRGESLAYMPQ